MNDYTSRFIQFSRPFVDAAKNIFQTMVFTEIAPQKPEMKKDSISRGDVSAFIGLTGIVEKDGETAEFTGMLVLSFPFETYLKVASAMLMDEYSEYSDEIADVGAEITNIITGNAKRDLSALGFKIEMSVPTSISGKDHHIKYPDKTNVIMIPMDSAHGKFFMELCYRDI